MRPALVATRAGAARRGNGLRRAGRADRGRRSAIYPVTVQGAAERPTALTKAPQRIVPLGPGPRRILRALRLDSRTVPVDDSLVGLPLVAQIRKARPDLIVASGDADPLDLARARSATHAAVYVTPQSSLERRRARDRRHRAADRPARRGAAADGLDPTHSPPDLRERSAARRRCRPSSTSAASRRLAHARLLGDIVRTPRTATTWPGRAPSRGRSRSRASPSSTRRPTSPSRAAGTTLAQLRANRLTKKLAAVRSGRFGVVPVRPRPARAGRRQGPRSRSRGSCTRTRSAEPAAASNRKLAGWLGLATGALAAFAYVGRASGGKPPRDALYQYGFAVSGLIEELLVLGIVLWIARGIPWSELGVRAPRSWAAALGLALALFVALLIVEQLLERVLHASREQGLEPSHWEPSKALAVRAQRRRHRARRAVRGGAHLPRPGDRRARALRPGRRPCRAPRSPSRQPTGSSRDSWRCSSSAPRSRSSGCAPGASSRDALPRVLQRDCARSGIRPLARTILPRVRRAAILVSALAVVFVPAAHAAPAGRDRAGLAGERRGSADRHADRERRRRRPTTGTSATARPPTGPSSSTSIRPGASSRT